MLSGSILYSCLVTLHCLRWSNGYAFQCYNWSAPGLPQNARERIELESVSVRSPGASCSPLGSNLEKAPSNHTCPEQQYPEDCRWRKHGSQYHGDDLPECDKELKNVRYQLLYNSKSQYSVHVQWDPLPGASSYNVMVSQSTRICTSNVNITEFWFSARYLFFDYSFDTWTIKIAAPGESCAMASVTTTSLTDCFLLCPGMCDCLKDRILQAPVNVRSCVMGEAKDVVSLQVSWEPVEKYYLGSPSNTFHLTLHNTSSVIMDTLQVMGTTSVYVNLRGLNMTQSYSVQVAHIICNRKLKSKEVPISLQRCQILVTANLTTQDNSTANVTMNLNSLDNISSTINLNTNSTVAESHMSSQTTVAHLSISSSISLPILVGITLAFFIAVLVLAALLMIMLITIKKYQFKGKLKDRSRLYPRGGKNDRNKDKTVLVLFSQASSIKDEMSVMEHVVKAVSLYNGIHCLYFDKPSVRTSVAEWVEGAIKRSDKVLLIVNKEFVKEWDSLKAYLPHGESLVYVARQVVDSFVMRDKQQLGKFALVFLRKEDQRSLLKDSLYLQTVKSYLVLPQAEAELEGLVRFILDVPTYTLPLSS